MNVTISNSGNTGLNLDSINISLFIDDIYNYSQILNMTDISNKTVNLSWLPYYGINNITIKIDLQDEINELSEENNNITRLITVLPKKGDFDHDDNLELEDFVKQCIVYTGPDAAGFVNPLADFDSDNDVDLVDFVKFLGRYNGNI